MKSLPASLGAVPASARPGQVPGGVAPAARLVFLTPRPGARLAELEAEARDLAGLGFGLALGLDPAERRARGWSELLAQARTLGALGLGTGFVVGACADHLDGALRLSEQLEGVVTQARAIEEVGGVPLLLPIPLLSRRRAKEGEYVECYQALFARLGGPLLVDWTSAALRPELFDYFPGQSFERVLALEPTKVRGARLALFDVAREARLRRALLARNQLCFTADRRHLAALLRGGNPAAPEPMPTPVARRTELAGRSVALGDFSHAMLALDGRAATLSVALERLAADDLGGYAQRCAEL
jgi:hypothetical protein